jgi:flavin-dependent dehydrogenase
MKKHDVIIIGGGPGGSTACSILSKFGLDVGIIEREEFPRFHIGESLLPATMPIFKEIGFFDKLNSGKYIQKWGARFIDYKTDDEVYFGFTDGFNTEIPMAFEVPRSEFDQDILEHALKWGATLYRPEFVKDVKMTSTGVHLFTDKDEYFANYLLDISGRDSVIGKKMRMRQTNKKLNNVAVFAHYEGVKRQPGIHEGDITIGLLPQKSWTWLIPFKGNATSVGVVRSQEFFDGEKDPGAYLENTLNQSPTVKVLMEGSKRVMDVQCIGNYSHTCETFFGDRWILCGDAAMFLDPIFSSGVHMSVSSSKYACEALLEIWPKKGSFKDYGIGEKYEKKVRLGAKRFYGMISMFYQGSFVEQMKKTLNRNIMKQGFTSAVAGDVWNEDNFLFSKNIL